MEEERRQDRIDMMPILVRIEKKVDANTEDIKAVTKSVNFMKGVSASLGAVAAFFGFDYFL